MSGSKKSLEDYDEDQTLMLELTTSDSFETTTEFKNEAEVRISERIKEIKCVDDYDEDQKLMVELKQLDSFEKTAEFKSKSRCSKLCHSSSKKESQLQVSQAASRPKDTLTSQKSPALKYPYQNLRRMGMLLHLGSWKCCFQGERLCHCYICIRSTGFTGEIHD